MTYLFDDAIRFDNSPNLDSFGRLRTSAPLTLFDSFHRFRDNGKITEYTSGTASSAHDANSATVLMSVGTASGDKIYRESAKVFAYQPGKSLLVLQTFCMNTGKTGLRQRIGYFGTQNGVYLEQDGTTLNLVRRTFVSGTVEELRIPKTSWNVDRLDGLANTTNPSGKTLHLDRVQILFSDYEWLGVGTVRVGFVIDGEFIVCHKFHHANQPTAAAANTSLPYMTTACLPVRAELENTAGTADASNFRLICTSVISEGGYELRGKSRSVGHAINGGITMSASNTVYPLMSIRLKSDRLDGIVVPMGYQIFPLGSGNYRYTIVLGQTTGGSWANTGTDSIVEYNLNPTSVNAGNTVAELGFIGATNQASGAGGTLDVPFKYQLERNSFTSTATEFILCVSTDASNQPKVAAAINWEEIT